MFRFYLFSILSFSAILANDFYEGDTDVKEGVYAFYNYDFEQAVNILTKARKDFPEHPGVHLIWAAARWVKAQSNLTVEETYNRLEADLKEIEYVYSDLVEKYPYNPVYRLYKGSSIGLKARVTLGRKQWLRTLSHGYKGFNIIEDISKNHPDIIDAQLPIGIIEYYAGISTSMLKWAVKLYGLNTSRDLGLQKINLAAESGSWSWIEAKSILSNVYLWVEDEPILALNHSRDLVKHFPRNFYFNLLHLESCIRTKDFILSKAIIEEMDNRLSKLSSRQIVWYEPYLLYEKALYFFNKNEINKALALVNKAVDSYAAELDIVLGNAYLLQGKCFDRLGKRKEAKESYNMCVDLNNLSDAILKSKRYLKNPYNGSE
jgi:tetratricopeptide (TPR) repeat protein